MQTHLLAPVTIIRNNKTIGTTDKRIFFNAVDRFWDCRGGRPFPVVEDERIRVDRLSECLSPTDIFDIVYFFKCRISIFVFDLLRGSAVVRSDVRILLTVHFACLWLSTNWWMGGCVAIHSTLCATLCSRPCLANCVSQHPTRPKWKDTALSWLGISSALDCCYCCIHFTWLAILTTIRFAHAIIYWGV